MSDRYSGRDMEDYNVSASQIKSHSQCPLKYWFRYIEGKESTKASSDYIKLGSRVHETLEELLTGDSKPPMHDRDILRDIIRDYYAQFEGYYLPKDLYEDGLGCCEKAADYIHKRQPEFRGIEQRVEFDLTRPDMSTGVTAIMDVVTENEVWDWKTGRIRDDTAHEEKIQGSLYMAAYYHLHGEEPDSIKFVYLKEEKVRSLDPTDENWNYMLSRAKRLLQSKKSGEFPANPGDHCYWCSYEFWCPEASAGCGDVPYEDY